MVKLLPRAEQGVLMMSSSLPSPTVQPAHTITWPAPPECSLWTWREVRLDTDWMNAVRAERERGGEDRQGQVETVTLPAWSHHSTSHHSQGRTENTEIIFNLQKIPPSFPQSWRHTVTLVIILITIQSVGSPVGINGVKIAHILLQQASPTGYPSQALMWPAGLGPNIILYFYWQSKPLITTESLHYTSHKVDLVSHPNPW